MSMWHISLLKEKKWHTDVPKDSTIDFRIVYICVITLAFLLYTSEINLEIIEKICLLVWDRFSVLDKK
jgi:hypothetical protein